MGMFLPADISRRITMFIEGKLEFPFIKKEELIGAFFIFGKNNGIYGEDQILAATDLAKRTVVHLTRVVRMFHNSPNKMDSNFTKENYTKRVLEISIECRIIQQILTLLWKGKNELQEIRPFSQIVLHSI